jgi:hypothetical protein
MLGTVTCRIHRREALERIIGKVLCHVRVHRQHGVIAHQQRVAIRRRLGDAVGSDHAGAAGPILDHDGRRVAGLGELLGEQTRQDVADAGRAVGTTNFIGFDG